MLSPSASLELMNKTDEPKPTLGKSLEGLDDLQLSNLIAVVAEDFKIKHEMKAQLRQKELALSEYGNRHRGRADGCAFCSQGFHLFKTGIVCERCSRSVCKLCQTDKTCNFCIELRTFYRRKHEWSVLCPFEEHTFGYAKMVANDLEARHFVDWTTKAKLELHLVHVLSEDLDNAFVCFTVTDNGLELIRQQLMVALLTYSSSSHFAFIDDSILEAKKIIQRRSNCTLESKAPVESFPYCYHLANAVISILINAASPKTKYANISKYHQVRPLFPPMDDDDLEEVRYAGSTPYALNSNWLLKPSFSSPRGSMRSQLSSHLVNSIVTPDFFKYGVSSEDKFGESQEEDPSSLDTVLGSESGYGTWKVDSTAEEFLPLAVHMQRQRVEVTTGQVVKIKAKIVADNLENVDVLWYNRQHEIKNGGRTRIRRDMDEAWIEIFDCDVSSDYGEIVCVAVNDYDLASDATILTVHEQDIAGEDPFIVDSLMLHPHNRTTVYEGSTIILKCRVLGYPQPYVNFFCNNHLLTEDNHDNIEIEHFDDTWILKIGNCTSENAGVYAAVAVNRIGKVTSRYIIAVKSFHTDDGDDKNKTQIVSV